MITVYHCILSNTKPVCCMICISFFHQCSIFLHSGVYKIDVEIFLHLNAQDINQNSFSLKLPRKLVMFHVWAFLHNSFPCQCSYSGLLHLLRLDSTPPPHVLVQCPHDDHELQDPSTTLIAPPCLRHRPR